MKTSNLSHSSPAIAPKPATDPGTLNGRLDAYATANLRGLRTPPLSVAANSMKTSNRINAMPPTTQKTLAEIEPPDGNIDAQAGESLRGRYGLRPSADAKPAKPAKTGNAGLTVTQQAAATGTEPTLVRLEGNIDAHAADSLRELYSLPAPAVRLDFGGVQRVNSMGLALLLKLFEHCENQGVAVQVANANRMTSMLFKMTNLDRYLAGATKKAAPAATPKAAPAAEPQKTPPTPAPRASEPAQEPAKPAEPLPTTAANAGKLVFLANMQNSQQLNGWYFFNTYLQRQLGRDIHLDLVHAAWDNELRPDATHLVFAQPFQATRLLLEHGFHLVARPADQADEVTVLVRAEDKRQALADFAGGKAVTDTAESFVYLLGRFLLDEGGLPSDSLDYLFTGHEIKAVRSLLNGEADILFLPTENYKSLSALTRSRLRPLDESDSGLAFHMFCLSPGCADLLPGLRKTLLEMSAADKGRQVLDDLGLASWSRPEKEEIDMLAMLYERYVSPK
jgi:anti-anti-sigma factor